MQALVFVNTTDWIVYYVYNLHAHVLKMVFNILGAKFEVVDSLPMDTRVWATHLPSELVPIERILKLGVKVCSVLLFSSKSKYFHFRTEFE